MREQKVYFHNDRGDRLCGIVHGGPRGVGVIACHGMLSNKDSEKYVGLAARLGDANIPCLRFDFAGRGESAGSLFDLTYSRQIQDLDAAIEYMVASGCSRLAVFGSSMGGAVALLTAARDERLVGVATMAAVGHPDGLSERYPRQVSKWREDGYFETGAGRIGTDFLDDAPNHSVLRAAATILAPIRVAHGEADEVVPCSDAHDIAAAARSATLSLVPDGDHRLTNPLHLRPELDAAAVFLRDVLEP